MHGGLSGALSLATAGELDLKDAAEIASTALNSFRKDNISVSRAADILAGAANASATDVSELKFSLSMVSAVASGVGLTFEDTSTALAELAQNGLKGSDAGTSLKTMLLNLTPSTTQAANMMASLGLITQNTGVAYQWLTDRGIKPASQSTKDVEAAMMKLAKTEVGAHASKAKLAKEYQTLSKYSGLTSSAFYDQNGKLKSLSDISGILSSHLSGLSEEQRQVALKTMLGTDAIRASNILYEEGAKGAKDMDAAINKVTANEVAKQKMDNLKGSIENLKGSLETAAITIGNELIPDIKSLTSEVQKGVDWFNSLDEGQKRLIINTAKWGTLLLGTFTTLGLGLKMFGSAVGGIKMLTGAASTAIKWLVPMGNATAEAGSAAEGAAGPLARIFSSIGSLIPGMGEASLGATGLAASLEVLSGPVGWAALGLTAATYGAIKFNESMKKPVMTVDLFNNKISSGTKKAISSYMDMNNKVTEQLNQMNWSGQAVTKDMASKITAEFKDMGGTITQSLDKDYNKNYNNLKQFFASAKGLSAKDKTATLQAVQAKYNEQKGYVTKGEAQITKIMQNASSHHRQLTDEEKNQINTIQANMEAVAVRTLSKGAKEQRTIFSELQAQNGKITAKQAADTVANSKKATNQAIKDANKKYDSIVSTLNHEYYDLHAISKKQMDDGIKAAQKERDGSVKAAKDMNKKVVSEAKKQAGDHANEIDWETGKVKDGWQKMWDDVSGFWTKIENFLGFGKSKGKSKSSGNSGGGGSHGGSLHAAAYASGTSSMGHPKDGPAIVGEKGPELAQIPGMGTTLLGTAGPTLIPNLPRGSAVLPNKQTESLLKSYGFPGYANGIGSFIGEVFTNPSKFIGDALGAAKITDGLLPSFFTQALGGSPAKAIGSMMLNGVKSLFSQITSSIGGGMSGQVKSWVSTAMAITGVPMNYLGSLLGLVQHESGGNPSAINLWDSNAKAGHPSKGLFQTIDSTFAKFSLPGLGDIYNPVANAVAGIRYALSRYGSIGNIPGIKAMASGGSYVGYASGAYGINTPQMAMLAEGGYPESVISFDPKLKARSQAIWQQTGQTLGFNADTKAQVSLLEELVDLIKQLLSQDKNVYMDGRKVNAILTNLTKQQEINRNIAKGIQMI
jgi:SLT domain-containing protein